MPGGDEMPWPEEAGVGEEEKGFVEKEDGY
jgi:hypothetical protein